MVNIKIVVVVELFLKLLYLFFPYIFILLVVYLIVEVSLSRPVSIFTPKRILALSLLQFEFLLLSFINDRFLFFRLNWPLDWLVSGYKGILLVLWVVLEFLFLELAFVLLDKIVLSWQEWWFFLNRLVVEVISFDLIIWCKLMVIGVKIVDVLIHLIWRWFVRGLFVRVIDSLRFGICIIAFVFKKEIVHDLIG